MTQERLTLGRQGERLAAEYLQRAGYRILEKNYRTRLGEIDLIAQDGRTLVFVEVKTRGTKTFGAPQEAVTKKKQQQLIRVAQEYLGREKLANRPARFDVVAVLFDKAEVVIELIKNAFELNPGG